MAAAEFRTGAQLTPWGPQPAADRLWLGLGIGAFGYCRPCYYRTTAAEAGYRQALADRQLPEKTLYCLPGSSLGPLRIAQSLLCRLQLPRQGEPALAERLLADRLVAAADPPRLTLDGIVRVAAIIRHLQLQTLWGEDRAASHRDGNLSV